MKVIGTAEATVVIADYFDLICDTDYAFDASEILRRMNANAVDVEPVKHGNWIKHEYAEESGGLLVPNYECSECHMWERKESDYCPNCGARMDEK